MKKKKRRNLKPKLRLELTLYGNRDVIIKNLKDAVAYIEANVSPVEQLLYCSKGIDYDISVKQLTPEDWFPGKKEKIKK